MDYLTQKKQHEIFLGGSCNPTTWRQDEAIPLLKNLGITFYNPKIALGTKEKTLGLMLNSKMNLNPVKNPSPQARSPAQIPSIYPEPAQTPLPTARNPVQKHLPTTRNPAPIPNIHPT
ncbi:hypothetical protein M8J76_017111 [Diaphorina citri]|nr:hypothetical protein M8J76_017111 [Diaphorina citri]